MSTPLPAEPSARLPSKVFTEYYFVTVLLLIACFVAGAFFLLRPKIIRIKQTNARIQSQLMELDGQRIYLASLEQSVAAAQSIAPTALERVQQALPDDVGTPSLLMQFSAAASRNGAQIHSISFLETRQTPVTAGRVATTSTAPSIGAVDIDLSLSAGRYLDVKRFLADVEASLRLMDVLSITSGSPGASGELTYHLQIRTYVFKTPAPRL